MNTGHVSAAEALAGGTLIGVAALTPWPAPLRILLATCGGSLLTSGAYLWDTVRQIGAESANWRASRWGRHFGRDVAHVMLFDNGLWGAFDQHGQQIPDLQGPDSEELRARIRGEYRGPVERLGPRSASRIILWSQLGPILAAPPPPDPWPVRRDPPPPA
jgi:hypothetical protein